MEQEVIIRYVHNTNPRRASNIPEILRLIPLLSSSIPGKKLVSKKGLRTKEKPIAKAMYTEKRSTKAAKTVGQNFLHLSLANLLKSLFVIISYPFLIKHDCIQKKSHEKKGSILSRTIRIGYPFFCRNSCSRISLREQLRPYTFH